MDDLKELITKVGAIAKKTYEQNNEILENQKKILENQDTIINLLSTPGFDDFSDDEGDDVSEADDWGIPGVDS